MLVELAGGTPQFVCVGLVYDTDVAVKTQALLKKTLFVQAVPAQPDGRLNETPVIANWLLVGLVIVTVMTWEPGVTGLFELVVICGREAFDAYTGEASGTRNTIVEKARRASKVPELNFVEYALVGVYMCIFELWPAAKHT